MMRNEKDSIRRYFLTLYRQCGRAAEKRFWDNNILGMSKQQIMQSIRMFTLGDGSWININQKIKYETDLINAEKPTIPRRYLCPK